MSVCACVCVCVCGCVGLGVGVCGCVCEGVCVGVCVRVCVWVCGFGCGCVSGRALLRPSRPRDSFDTNIPHHDSGAHRFAGGFRAPPVGPARCVGAREQRARCPSACAGRRVPAPSPTPSPNPARADGSPWPPRRCGGSRRAGPGRRSSRPARRSRWRRKTSRLWCRYDCALGVGQVGTVGGWVDGGGGVGADSGLAFRFQPGRARDLALRSYLPTQCPPFFCLSVRECVHCLSVCLRVLSVRVCARLCVLSVCMSAGVVCLYLCGCCLWVLSVRVVCLHVCGCCLCVSVRVCACLCAV